MIAALVLAATDLGDARLRRAVLVGLGSTLALFAILWAVIAGWLIDTALFEVAWLDVIVDTLGIFASLLASWVLFPAVATAVLSTFFLDGVVDALEARHYPGLPPPRRQSFADVAGSALALGGLMIVLNLLALPIYFLVPGLNLVLFYLLNGYLLGREYFELVALRRAPQVEVKSLRRVFGFRMIAAGAVITFAFTVPLLNLITPVLAAAFMTHLCHRQWRIAEFGSRLPTRNL